MFKESVKCVLRKFQGCFKEDCGVFLETFNDDSRELQGHPKEVQSVLQGSFIDILRNFQGCLNKVSSVFQEHLKKVERVFQECFAILFLHGSHRSYPIRRRACSKIYFSGFFF